jgi:hypothetical protein
MNEIDDIFKKAAQDKKGEFNPAYWDSMTMLIDKDKKKKKAFFWFFLTGGIIALIGIVFFFNNLKEASTNNIAQGYNTQKDEDNVNKEVLAEKKNSESQNINLNTTEVKKNNKIENNKDVKAANKTNPSNKLDYTHEELNNKVNRLESESKIVNTAVKKPLKTTIIDVEPKKEAVFSLNINVVSSKRKTEDLIVFKSKELDELIAPNYIESISNDKLKLIILPEDVFKKHHFNILLGGAFYDDFNIDLKETNIKLGMIAGVEYEYRLTPKLSLSTQVLGYNRKSKTARLIFETTAQSFGEIQKTAIYDYSDFYFIEIPLNINYKLAPSHKVGFGPYYTKLITTKVNVLQQKGDLILNAKNESKSDKYVYHFDTFTLNNYGANIDYEYSFNRFNFNIGYSLALNYFVNKTTFSTTYNNDLSKLYFKLKYRLF